MKRNYVLNLAMAVGALFAAVPATVGAVTGTYTFGGETTGAGPYTMTSTDTTFSVLRFIFDTPVTFADLTNISVDYNAVLGGIGGGAPRLAVVFADDQYLEINFGPAGSFADPTLGPGNTGNLLSLTDPGRFDNSGIGGLFYSDYASALAIAAGFSVVRTSLVLDSFGGADRNFIINGINVAAIPEPSSYALALAGLALVGFAVRRRKESTAAEPSHGLASA